MKEKFKSLPSNTYNVPGEVALAGKRPPILSVVFAQCKYIQTEAFPADGLGVTCGRKGQRRVS